MSHSSLLTRGGQRLLLHLLASQSFFTTYYVHSSFPVSLACLQALSLNVKQTRCIGHAKLLHALCLLEEHREVVARLTELFSEELERFRRG